MNNINNRIGIIGGDLRIIYLTEIFAKEGKTVFTYLLDNYEFNLKDSIKNIIKCSSLEEFKNVNTIITSIPISKDKVNIYSPYSSYNLEINELLMNFKSKTIYTGAISEETKQKAEKKYNIEIIDLLKNEELSILNAIPTAEGAIKIAIEKSSETLHNSNVLVLGFGRIGKILSKMLNGIGAKVYVEARKESDLAQIKSYGYTDVDIIDLNIYLPRFDYIFNTIPHIILDKDELDLIKKECILVDLASFPGGINFEYSKKLGLNASLELALPGKIAPKTTAKYIRKVIKI